MENIVDSKTQKIFDSESKRYQKFMRKFCTGNIHVIINVKNSLRASQKRFSLGKPNPVNPLYMADMGIYTFSVLLPYHLTHKAY